MAQAKTKACKITISLTPEMVRVADTLAGEGSTTRSAIIAKLLKKAEEDRLVAMMREDKEWQEESLRIVAEGREKAAEMWSEIPWDEAHG